MVGEEGRAQVTRGTGRQRKKQTKPTPTLFSPLGVYGLPHINSKQFLAVMQVSDVILSPILFRSHRYSPIE
jgi:hypothetical protein